MCNILLEVIRLMLCCDAVIKPDKLPDTAIYEMEARGIKHASCGCYGNSTSSRHNWKVSTACVHLGNSNSLLEWELCCVLDSFAGKKVS